MARCKACEHSRYYPLCIKHGDPEERKAKFFRILTYITETIVIPATIKYIFTPSPLARWLKEPWSQLKTGTL